MTVSRGGLEFEIRRRRKETIIHSVSVTKCLNSWTQLSYAKSIPVIFGIVLFPPIPLVQFVPIHPITLLQTEPSQAHLCVTWATVWTRNSLHSWNRLNIHKFKEYAIFIYIFERILLLTIMPPHLCLPTPDLPNWNKDSMKINKYE